MPESVSRLNRTIGCAITGSGGRVYAKRGSLRKLNSDFRKGRLFCTGLTGIQLGVQFDVLAFRAKSQCRDFPTVNTEMMDSFELPSECGHFAELGAN